MQIRLLPANCHAYGFLVVLTVAAISIACHQDRHPDTSPTPAYARYTEIQFDFAPAWSGDGVSIVFSREAKRQVSLWTSRANGNAAHELLADAGVAAASPDGKWLVFSSGRRRGWFDVTGLLGNRPWRLWLAEPSGQGARPVTSSDQAELDPVWSPDGKRIAFTAFPGPRVMVTGINEKKAVNFADGWSPAWSPDGNRIAYYSCDSMMPGARCVIVVKQLADGTATTLHCLYSPVSALGRPSLEWSSDGRSLLTTNMEQGAFVPIIIAVNEDRIERSIAVSGSATHPRWSKQGDQIVYSVTDTGRPPGIEVQTLADGTRTSIDPGPAFTGAQLVLIKSEDGLEIPSWLYFPGKEPAKHPAVVWLHGGIPGTGTILNQFEPAMQYLIDNGFVVLAPNYRGSIGFGAELREPRHVDPLPDVAAAVRYLRGLSSVEPSQIALVGFSFGGFLTLRAITNTPDLVAAAVDFYGQSDLSAFYRRNPATRGVLTSLLGGSPEQKPELYHSLSPIHFANRMRVPLLAIYGEHDPDYQDASALRRALDSGHKNFEFISYSSGGHVLEGADDIDAKQQMMRFLTSHLLKAR